MKKTVLSRHLALERGVQADPRSGSLRHLVSTQERPKEALEHFLFLGVNLTQRPA